MVIEIELNDQDFLIIYTIFLMVLIIILLLIILKLRKRRNLLEDKLNKREGRELKKSSILKDPIIYLFIAMFSVILGFILSYSPYSDYTTPIFLLIFLITGFYAVWNIDKA